MRRADFQKLPGALVLQGDYYGSLAAVRCLGEAGVPILFAEHRRFVPGPWSRYVRRRFTAPAPVDLPAFGDWLVAFGREHPGLFLYPTSDDLCWILDTRADELAQTFRLHPSRPGAMRSLLDKRELSAAASRVGLTTPTTWFPADVEAVRRLAEQIPAWPVLLKPRTQMGFLTKGKGALCGKREDLATAVSRFLDTERYHSDVLKQDPSIAWPMIQTYHASAVDGILSVAGYVGESSEAVVLRASQKVFQRPRRLGVGVGFEARDVPPALGEQLVALCRTVGYAGVFEAEFLDGESAPLLVDFNPRYYGQMAFEIARGLPSPVLACLAATGKSADVDSVAAEARAAGSGPEASRCTFALTWILRLLLVTQRLGRKMTAAEAAKWRQWLRDPAARHFDALFDGQDPLPAWLDVLTQVAFFLRHPRDFYRKFFRDT